MQQQPQQQLLSTSPLTTCNRTYTMHEAISEMDGSATCPQLHHLISAYTAADAPVAAAARGADADKNLALIQLLDNNKWLIVSCYR